MDASLPGCPAACPVACLDQKECRGYGLDENGCPNPTICIDWYYTSQTTGEVCSTYCPTYCHPDEILCPGEVSVYSGCQMSYDYCLPAFKEGHKLGSMCESFCKPQCNSRSGPEFEKCCHGGYDENGCELPGWCAGEGEGCPHGYCLT